MPAYHALDARLTAPLAAPADPPAHCTLRGAPAVCALDGLIQIEAWRGTLERCNADRATASDVTTGGAQ